MLIKVGVAVQTVACLGCVYIGLALIRKGAKQVILAGEAEAAPRKNLISTPVHALRSVLVVS